MTQTCRVCNREFVEGEKHICPGVPVHVWSNPEGSRSEVAALRSQNRRLHEQVTEMEFRLADLREENKTLRAHLGSAKVMVGWGLLRVGNRFKIPDLRGGYARCCQDSPAVFTKTSPGVMECLSCGEQTPFEHTLISVAEVVFGGDDESAEAKGADETRHH
jgi:hypothetical protein